MTPVVACRELCCRLGERLVLSELNLELRSGESFALLGCSGSGKSTLLRVIAGLEIPERGEVLIAGQPASRDGRLLIPPHRRHVAMLFQDLALWPNLRVAENVRLALEGLRLPRQVVAGRVSDALKLCGIADLAARLPGTLSGGQQQRVAVARALAAQPRLLLLDEPFGGLDLVTKEQIVQQIAKLKAELGFASILVTHDPTEVECLCDSLGVLQDGRFVERGPLNEIMRSASSALGRAFVQRLAHRE